MKISNYVLFLLSLIFVISCSQNKSEDKKDEWSKTLSDYQDEHPDANDLTNVGLRLLTVKNVDETKALIDSYLFISNVMYEDLCLEPRNDKLKGDFQDLSNYIKTEISSISSYRKLDYKQQEEVQKYFFEQLELYPKLNALISGEISCW